MLDYVEYIFKKIYTLKRNIISFVRASNIITENKFKNRNEMK